MRDLFESYYKLDPYQEEFIKENSRGRTVLRKKRVVNQYFEAIYENKRNFSEKLDADIDITNLSMVTRRRIFCCTSGPIIRFWLNDGSKFSVSSVGEDCLEIVSIAVSNRGCGIGRKLLKTFMEFCRELFGYVPKLYLECVGAIDNYGVRIVNDISNQTSFFRKFDFKVQNRHYYPQYVNMVRERTQ